MNPVFAFIFTYLLGACAIHAFCVYFIAQIPLLDQYALSIRNFLCIVWLIITIIMVITGTFSK